MNKHHIGINERLRGYQVHLEWVNKTNSKFRLGQDRSGGPTTDTNKHNQNIPSTKHTLLKRGINKAAQCRSQLSPFSCIIHEVHKNSMKLGNRQHFNYTLIFFKGQREKLLKLHRKMKSLLAYLLSGHFYVGCLICDFSSDHTHTRLLKLRAVISG